MKRLNRIVRLYVPGTVNNQLDPKSQETYVDLALEKFSDLFGGATAMDARGAWKTSSGILVKEPVVLVFSFTDEDGLAEHRESVEQFAKRLAVEMMQECVSVEIDGELHFIEPQPKAA